jgi:AraC-like DNA-binding protein
VTQAAFLSGFDLRDLFIAMEYHLSKQKELTVLNAMISSQRKLRNQKQCTPYSWLKREELENADINYRVNAGEFYPR